MARNVAINFKAKETTTILNLELGEWFVLKDDEYRPLIAGFADNKAKKRQCWNVYSSKVDVIDFDKFVTPLSVEINIKYETM